ncbi:MAG: glutamate--tRNA ligase [Candidatus Bathyarchaeia archaeon]
MSMDLRVFREEVFKYALINAVKYNGKARVEPVVSKFLGEHRELRNRAREVVSMVEEVVKEVNSLTLAEQKRILEEKFPELLVEEEPKKREFKLPPLPNVEKYSVIVTRYAPNPDFVLHFGQARAIYLSHDYARMYNGIFILRFEDTDPRVKKPKIEFYDAIREDLIWLGCKWDKEYIQSKRLEIYYSIAKKLIDIGGAYVCTCNPDIFRSFIRSSNPCPCRDLAVEYQAERFDKMLEGVYEEGEAVLRVKTDLSHPNPSVRDWVALRIIDTKVHPHPIVGDKYHVWPTYNFAAGVDDHLMEVSHIIRGKEFLVSVEKQMYMYRWLGWDYPEHIHYGKWMMIGAGTMSKSKMLRDIQLGLYKSWDDPRLPTLAALRRRGIQPESIHRMILELGVKLSEVRFSWENLYAYNRKIIDPIARRFFYVADPIRLRIKSIPLTEVTARIPFHPNKEDMGYREIKVKVKDGVVELYISKSDTVILATGNVVRLIGLFNINPISVSDKIVEAVWHSRSYEEAAKLRARLIHWVPIEENVAIRVVMPDASESSGYGEKLCETISLGEVIQFERFGFAKFDSKLPDGTMVFYYTHD